MSFQGTIKSLWLKFLRQTNSLNVEEPSFHAGPVLDAKNQKGETSPVADPDSTTMKSPMTQSLIELATKLCNDMPT